MNKIEKKFCLAKNRIKREEQHCRCSKDNRNVTVFFKRFLTMSIVLCRVTLNFASHWLFYKPSWQCSTFASNLDPIVSTMAFFYSASANRSIFLSYKTAKSAIEHARIELRLAAKKWKSAAAAPLKSHIRLGIKRDSLHIILGESSCKLEQRRARRRHIRVVESRSREGEWEPRNGKPAICSRRRKVSPKCSLRNPGAQLNSRGCCSADESARNECSMHCKYAKKVGSDSCDAVIAERAPCAVQIESYLQ